MAAEAAEDLFVDCANEVRSAEDLAANEVAVADNDAVQSVDVGFCASIFLSTRK